MDRQAIDWVNGLAKRKVTLAEKAVLRACADLASRKHGGAIFASNETLARLAGITRRHVIRCKRSLTEKGFIVRAKAPRFETETRWYYLSVGCAELGLSPSLMKDTMEEPKLRVSTSDMVSPYIFLRFKKTKVRAISPAKRPVRLHKSRPFPSEKENGVRTKNNPEAATPRFTTSGAVSEENREHLPPPPRRVDVQAILDAWFSIFWWAFPRKQHKAKAYALFMRLKPSYHLVRMMLASIDAAKSSGEWGDLRYVPTPTKWLAGKRWSDEYAPAKKSGGLVL